MTPRLHTGAAVRYSEEGRRVLCRKGDRFAADPERAGTFLGMVTAKVGRVMWSDRRSPQYLHIDYLEPATVIPPVARPAGASVPAHSSRSAAVLPTDSPADSVPAPRTTGTLAPSPSIPGDGASNSLGAA